MNLLLDSAVAAFLDTASERALDEPLMAVLRDRGYSHVALTHGPQEWGKDIVARKDDEQWVFQSKAGDVGQSAWRSMTGQLDELRLSNYGGPEFDRDLPRRCVLILSGRLVGNAPLAAHEYNERAEAQGAPPVEIWNRDQVLGDLVGSPHAVLRNSVDGALMAALGAAERNGLDAVAVEQFCERWDDLPDHQLCSTAVVEASLLAAACAASERLDLATHVGVSLTRAAWAGSPRRRSARKVADAGRSIFRTYAAALWQQCDDSLLEPDTLIGTSGPSAWITYPVKCVRIIEILGLFGLLLDAESIAGASEIGGWLEAFCEKQPGVARAVSDFYAISYVPAAILLNRHAPRGASPLLEGVAGWLCDQTSPTRGGLAGAGGVPDEEVRRLFGTALEHVPEAPHRKRSLLAAVLLDLSLLTGDETLFADIRNDLLAVGAVPVLLECPDSSDQYRLSGDNNRWISNPPYPTGLPVNAVRGPAHLRPSHESRELLREDRSWDLLAVSSALRDRYFSGSIRHEMHARPRAGGLG